MSTRVFHNRVQGGYADSRSSAVPTFVPNPRKRTVWMENKEGNIVLADSDHYFTLFPDERPTVRVGSAKLY